MNNASLGPTAMGQHLVYKVYDNEQHAARAAQLLVEAGFPAQQVYIGVERDRRLARASTGRGQRLGLAMLVGAAISAALGAMIVSAATIDFVDTPLALLAGMSPMTIAVLALAPLANAETLSGPVVGVADGDTLTVLDETRTQHKIRLAGVRACLVVSQVRQRARRRGSSRL